MAEKYFVIYKQRKYLPNFNCSFNKSSNNIMCVMYVILQFYNMSLFNNVYNNFDVCLLMNKCYKILSTFV